MGLLSRETCMLETISVILAICDVLAADMDLRQHTLADRHLCDSSLYYVQSRQHHADDKFLSVTSMTSSADRIARVAVLCASTACTDRLVQLYIV
jgi:hypothetical protein